MARHPKRSRLRQPPVDCTEAQQEAIDKAMSNYRRSTGKNITWADIARSKGAEVFCKENGVDWPQEMNK